MGGRPVQWTCLGEPGASAGWIVRELERFPGGGGDGGGADGGTDAEDEEEEDEDEDDEDDDGDGRRWGRWFRETFDVPGHVRHMLESEQFDAAAGRYDVAVVLTGPNDLKFAVLPFMLQGEDREFRREARRRGGDYAAELRRVVDALLSDKMKAGLSESMDRVRAGLGGGIDRVRAGVEAAVPENIRDRMNWTALPSADGRRAAEDETEGESSDADADAEAGAGPPAGDGRDAGGARGGAATATAAVATAGGRPLVVLPALPARNLPVLRWIPVRWLALPLLRAVEGVKRTLARRYPADILFVDAPDSGSMIQFERGTGPLRRGEGRGDGGGDGDGDGGAVVALTDADPAECARLVGEMREYYAGKGGGSSQAEGAPTGDGRNGNTALDSRGRPNVRPGSAGATMLSADKLHPNDLGYDFWGRYIARAITDEWAAERGDG